MLVVKAMWRYCLLMMLGYCGEGIGGGGGHNFDGK